MKPNFPLFSLAFVLGCSAGGVTPAWAESLANIEAMNDLLATEPEDSLSLPGQLQLSSNPVPPEEMSQSTSVLSRHRQTSTPVTIDQLSADPAPQLNATPSAQRSLGQVTSVSQLSDVRPTDWAYQAWPH